MSHFLIWPVVVPLLALPIGYLFCQLTACRYYPYYLSLSILNFLPLGILTWVLAGGEILKYELGGWMFDRGIVLVLDPLALFMLVLIQIYFFLAIIISGTKGNFDPRHFFVLLFLGQAGLSGMVLTADLFNLYLFLEITSLSFYALVAFKRTPEGLEAGFKYLVLGTCGGFIILWGVGLIYSVAGNLNLAYLANNFVDVPPQIRVAVLALFTVGFALKFAIFPLHAWKVDALTAAPDTIKLLLAALTAKIPIYCLLRIYSLLFGWEFLKMINLPLFLGIFSVITIIVGHLMAYRQQRLTRLLAYSSMAHVGYITAAIATATRGGINGALFHVLNHGVMKGGLFLIAGALIMYIRSDSLEEMRGIYYQQPLLIGAFIILALGMIGLPPVNGFLSKWQMVISTMESGFYISSFAIILGGFLALLYYTRIVIIFFDTSVASAVEEADFSKMDLYLKLPITFLVLVSLFSFIGGNQITSLINNSTSILFKTEPYLQLVMSGS